MQFIHFPCANIRQMLDHHRSPAQVPENGVTKKNETYLSCSMKFTRCSGKL